MKTFITSLPARIKTFNDKLDVKNALCGKSWEVFNEEGGKQLFIFNADGTLLVTLNGKVVKSSWQYIPENKSVLISTANETTMFLPVFYDEIVFALQQKGVAKYLLMIDEQKEDMVEELSYQSLLSYMYMKKEIERVQWEEVYTRPPKYPREKRKAREKEEKMRRLREKFEE